MRTDWGPSSSTLPGPDDAEAFYGDLIGGMSGHFESWPETSPVALPATFRMGVWIDVGGAVAKHAADHATRLEALGVTDACIMVNGVSKKTFAYSSVSKAQLRAFAGLIAMSTIRLTLTTWLRPKRAFIDALVADLPAFAQEIGARAIEFDVEEPWTNAKPVGFATHTEAADYLFAGLRAAQQTGLEVATTCQVDQVGTSKMQRLIELSDVIVPQAYSTKSASKSHKVGGAYGPRGLQQRAANRIATALAMSGTPIVMGLAAYSRSGWPGQSARDIMQMELEETVGLRSAHTIQGARYWSWKHIAGNKGRGGSPANSYAGKFLEDVATP